MLYNIKFTFGVFLTLFSCILGDKTPPTGEGDNIFVYYGDYNIYDKAILYVPKGCIEAYKNAYPWGAFHNVMEE